MLKRLSSPSVSLSLLLALLSYCFYDLCQQYLMRVPDTLLLGQNHLVSNEIILPLYFSVLCLLGLILPFWPKPLQLRYSLLTVAFAGVCVATISYNTTLDWLQNAQYFLMFLLAILCANAAGSTIASFIRNPWLQKILHYVVIALCLVSFHFGHQYDLVHRGSLQPLAPTTQSLLNQTTSIDIVLHASKPTLKNQLSEFVRRVRIYHSNTTLSWSPDLVVQGRLKREAIEIIVGNKHAYIYLADQPFNENSFAKALFQLKQKSERWVAFLQNHQEPLLFKNQSDSYALFASALKNQGIHIEALNLKQSNIIPDNIQTLVIASPLERLSPIEEALILDYLEQGKNLFWLISPHGYTPGILAKYFGLGVQSASETNRGAGRNPYLPSDLKIIKQFPSLPIQTPAVSCVFPDSVILSMSTNDYQISPLYTKQPSQTIGYFLTRAYANHQQRIIIMGSSTFLTNNVIQSYGNLALGLNMIHWLNQQDDLAQIQQPAEIDQMITLTTGSALMIHYGFISFSLLILFVHLVRRRI